MKKNIITSALICGAAMCSFSAAAQSLSTGYFSEGYIFRHQQNPALAVGRNYIALPIVGNISTDMGMNIGVKNFIYEQPNGKLTTFMNSSVSAQQFLADLPDKPQLNLNTDFNLFSFGFRSGRGYTTFEVGAHVRANAIISKDLFYFMKDMSSNTTYNFSDLQATAMSWADVAIGHSHSVTDDLRIGMKAKLLIGLGYANADLSGTNATLGNDAWVMNVNGTMNVAGGGYMTHKQGSNEMTGYKDFTPGVNGLGIGVDLGVTYNMEKLLPGLTLSAAVTDLGVMSWDCARAGATNKQFRFDGFNNAKMHDGEGTGDGRNDGSMSEQWERISDDLQDAFKLDVLEDGKTKENLGATVHAGVEYKLPVYDKLKFGALYTQRFSEKFAYNEARLVVNYAPVHAVDIALSGSTTSYGMTAGALLNFNLPGINLFLGVDRIYTGSVNKDNIPLEKCSFNFATGFNITFGSWEE